MVDVDLLNIAPDRQLSNRDNSGNDFSLENQDIAADDGYFPDYFPLTTFNVFNVVLHISSGSCSTHPLFGKNCLNSFCEINNGFPFKSNKIDLVDVVP